MAYSYTPLIPEKGSAGEFTFFTRNGRKMVRQRGTVHAKRKLTARMALSSCKLSNVMTAWRSAGGKLQGLFETRKAGQSEYNVFVSQNLDRARVHLSKEQAERYWGVADNFVVSLGTLTPSINILETDEYFISDISVGNLVITPETTKLNFSGAVVKNNGERFRDGDCLKLLVYKQENSSNNLPPTLSVERYSFELKCNNFDYYSAPMGTDKWMSVNGFLAFPKREGMLVAWVQTRRQLVGPDRVTTQSLVGSNPLVERFVGLMAEYEAIESYGPLKESSARLPNGMDYHEMKLMAQEVIAGLRPAPAQPQPAPSPLELIPLTLSVSSPTAGTVKGAGRFPKGAAVQIEAHPEEGYEFLCWDDGEREPIREINIMEPVTYKAIFGKQK